MQKYYQIRRNLIISILFLIQYNYMFSRLIGVYKKHLTSVAKDHILVGHHPLNKITKIQILGCKYFLLYSLIYLDILIYLYSFICIILFIFILLIIRYCIIILLFIFIFLIISYYIIIHPRICIFVILLSGWCRMRMRRAHLVSNSFLYTTLAALEPVANSTR